MERDEEEDERVSEEELVIISRGRQKRNLVSCIEEDKQALLWARTAEWMAVDVPANTTFSPPPSTADGQPALTARTPTVVGHMAELGLAYDPCLIPSEKRCTKCGAKRPDEAELDGTPALLLTDGNLVAPLKGVRRHGARAVVRAVIL